MQLFSYKKKKISRKWEKILFGIFFRIFTQVRMPSCKVVDVLHKAFCNILRRGKQRQRKRPA